MDHSIPWLDTLQYPHHRQAVLNLRDAFKDDREVLALILGGSVCHGYARADSDIDCMILVGEEDYAARRKEDRLHYFSLELAGGYEGGYIDGKYQSLGFIRSVADRGSEPARFAFKDAKIVFSRDEGLEDLLRRAAAYPETGRQDRIVRFHAQLDAMHWFLGEGVKRSDLFTRSWASANLVLFGCRMLLAHNRVLFPCTKTMTHELKRCGDLPKDVFERIDALLRMQDVESGEAFYRCVKDFREWEQNPKGWPMQYMLDTEIKWMAGSADITDL